MPNRAQDADVVKGHPRTSYKESRQAEIDLFSRRVWRLMVAKGWNQSELSRETKLHDPRGRGIGRDMISGYIRKHHLPDPLHAKILAATFGVPIEDLFPISGQPTEDRVAAASEVLPDIELVFTEAGRAMLRVNLEVSRALAVKVVALLQSEGEAA